MSWLTTGAAGAIDLLRNRDLAAVLAQLDLLLETSGAIAGQRSLTSLLERALANPAIADSVAALLTADAASAWRTLLGGVAQGQAAALGALGCRLQDLESERCLGSESGLSWPLLSVGESAARIPDRIQPDDLSLALAGGGQSSIELVPEVPDAVGSIDALRMTLRGATEAAAGFSLPIRIGRIGTRVAGQAALELHYRWAAHGNDRVIDLLVEALPRLPSPFDLFGISEELLDASLLSLEIDARADGLVQGALTVGESFDLVAGTAVRLGLDLAGSEQDSARVRLRLVGERREPEPSVLLDLSWGTAAQTIRHAGFGVLVDPSPVVERFAQRLADHAGDAAATMEHLAGLLPPSAWVGSILSDGIKALPRDFLTGVESGPTPAGELGGRLRRLLLDAIDAEELIWTAATRDLAPELTRRAAAGLGLDATAERELVGLVAPLMGDALSQLQRELGQRLSSLPSPAPSLGDGLRSGLRFLGRAAPALGDSAADATALLQRGQGLLRSLAAAVGKAAESKIAARLRHESVDTTDRQVQGRLRLYPLRSGAQALFERLVTDDPSQVLAEVDERARDTASQAPFESLGVSELVAGSMHRELRNELVLLDVALAKAGILDANIAIEADQAGNVRVFSRTESRRESRGLGELRVTRAVNVFELASAGESRRMTFSLSVSHREEELDDDEVLSFFDALEQVRLLAEGAGRRALDLLNRSLGTDRNTLKRQGEMRVWLELDGGDLMRLLQITRPERGLAGNPLDKRKVYAAAVSAITTGHRHTGAKTTLNNLMDFISTERLGSDLASVLLQMDNPQFRNRLRPHPTESVLGGSQEDFRLLEAMSDRALALVRLIDAMREVWFAPLGTRASGWNQHDYQERQRIIDEQTQFWLRGELFDRGFKSFFSEALRPYTLALFIVVAALAAEVGQAPGLRSSLWLDDESGGRELPLVGE